MKCLLRPHGLLWDHCTCSCRLVWSGHDHDAALRRLRGLTMTAARGDMVRALKRQATIAGRQG
jgi:hypothetical protein